MNEIVYVKCHKDRGGCGTTFRVRRKNGELNRSQLFCPCCAEFGPYGRTKHKLSGKWVIDVVDPPAPKEIEEAAA